MIRNIIFDWSGTLVDDLPAVLVASNHVFVKAGVPELTLDQFRAEFCLPFKSFYDRYVPHLSLRQLEEWFHESFQAAQDKVVALPHAKAFLECCRANGLRTFVLSSVRRDHYAAQAGKTGFGAFIDHPVTEVWDKRERIHSLLDEHKLVRSETMFIGDMAHDIDTARHGGVFSCAVLTGYNRLDQLRASQPDLVVEHLGELRQLLERSGFALGNGAGPNGTKHPDHGGPIGTVGALIFDDVGRVLMVRTRKWSSLWGIPGGKIKDGESSEAALRREILEETGLPIHNIRFVLVQDCIDSTEFYRPAHFLLLNYTCATSQASQVVLNDEADAFQWVTPTDALLMPINQPTRVLLQQVVANSRTTGEQVDR